MKDPRLCSKVLDLHLSGSSPLGKLTETVVHLASKLIEYRAWL